MEATSEQSRDKMTLLAFGACSCVIGAVFLLRAVHEVVDVVAMAVLEGSALVTTVVGKQEHSYWVNTDDEVIPRRHACRVRGVRSRFEESPGGSHVSQ